MNDLEVRVLAPDEGWRLLEFEPFKTYGVPPADLSQFVVVEDLNGKIVGYWGLVQVCHFEPLWIAPEHRKRYGLALRMWRKVRQVAESLGIRGGFAIIQDDNPESMEVKHQAVRVGFEPVQGVLFKADLMETE